MNQPKRMLNLSINQDMQKYSCNGIPFYITKLEKIEKTDSTDLGEYVD